MNKGSLLGLPFFVVITAGIFITIFLLRRLINGKKTLKNIPLSLT